MIRGPPKEEQPNTSTDSSRPQSIHDNMTYGQRLWQYTVNRGPQEPRFLIFRGLQALNIVQLQNDLAKYKNTIWDNKSADQQETEKLTRLLHDYTNAIRDYEYLSKLIPITDSQARKGCLDLEQAFEEVGDFADDATSYRRFPDPSLLTTDALRDILKRILPRSVTYTKKEMRLRVDEYLSGQPPHDVSPFVDVLARFLVAFLGGALLVVPMLVMRLPDVNVVKSLCTVSVSVLIFAGALSVFFKAKNTYTLIATATYAAVLVVFVGTSS